MSNYYEPPSPPAAFYDWCDNQGWDPGDDGAWEAFIDDMEAAREEHLIAKAEEAAERDDWDYPDYWDGD